MQFQYLKDNAELNKEIRDKLKPVDNAKLEYPCWRTCKNVIETAFQDFRMLYYDDGYEESVFDSFDQFIFVALYEQPIDIKGIEQLGFPKDIVNIIHKMAKKLFYIFIIIADYVKRDVLIIDYMLSRDEEYIRYPEFVQSLNRQYLIKLLHHMNYIETETEFIWMFQYMIKKIAKGNVRFIENVWKLIKQLLDLPDDFKIENIESE